MKNRCYTSVHISYVGVLNACMNKTVVASVKKNCREVEGDVTEE